MPDRITTTSTKNGFRVEDITFKNARSQSEVAKAVAESEESVVECTVPVSLTPESVKTFLSSKAEATMNMNERKLYLTVCDWVTDYFELKKKVVALEMKLEVKEKEKTVTEDI